MDNIELCLYNKFLGHILPKTAEVEEYLSALFSVNLFYNGMCQLSEEEVFCECPENSKDSGLIRETYMSKTGDVVFIYYGNNTRIVSDIEYNHLK